MSVHEDVLGSIRSALEQRDCCPRGPRDKITARCPAHDDHQPSLSVGLGGDGRVLVHCHAGCEPEAVLGALGLAFADLYPDERTRIVATYPYVDEQGEVLFEVVRFDPKGFRQRRPGGKWGLGKARRVLYRLPQLIDAIERGKAVYIVEGEEDVHAAERAGVCATCNPMGAGKWRREYTSALKGARVVVVADRDEPGQKHARDVAESLDGVAAEVSIVEPTTGKDLRDHLAAGRAIDDLATICPTEAALPRGSTRASSINPRRVRWVERGRIARGYVCLQTGESSIGKTLYFCGRAAKLTRGELDGDVYDRPSRVLIVASEDARDDMWVPRLMAAGADLDLIEFQDQGREWNLRDGLALTATILDRDRFELAFIDSVLEHMPESKGGENVYSPTFIRRALGPFADLCKEKQIAGQISTHPPKAKGSTFAEMVIASAAFVHMTRVGLLFGWHPDDLELPDQERRRVLMRPPGGSNIGRDPGALEFQIMTKKIVIEGEPEEVPFVTGPVASDVTFRDLVRAPKDDAPAPKKIAQARAIIETRLADGDWHPSMFEELTELGFSKATAYRAAEHVVKRKAETTDGGWWWIAKDSEKTGGSPPWEVENFDPSNARSSSHDENFASKSVPNGTAERSSQVLAEPDETPSAPLKFSSSQSEENADVIAAHTDETACDETARNSNDGSIAEQLVAEARR